METRKIAAEARGSAEKNPRPAELQCVLWNEDERRKRALKFGGYCWLGAIASIPLPIAHFILVPGFLLAGPFVFFKVRKQEGQILDSPIECPECGAAASVPKSALAFPIETLCPKCQSRITLHARG